MLDTELKHVLRTTGRHISKLKTLGMLTVRDFVAYFPRTYTDSRNIRKIIEMRIDETNVVKGKISNFFSRKSRNGKFMTRALLTDNTGSIEVIWFNQPHVTRLIPGGSMVVLSGKLKQSGGKFSLVSPIYEIEKEEQIHTARIVPVYHETEGITSKWLREKLKPIIDEWTGEFDEYMPEEILKKHSLIPLKDAMKWIHFPKNKNEIIKARKRLSFDELFLIQFKALKKKWEWQNSFSKSKKILIDKELVGKFLKSLPFELTEAQKKAAKEILIDLQKDHPMSRLLQGDVGSGKTVVAALAALVTAKSGYQTAVMAPTEILALQHEQTLTKFLAPFGIKIRFISGGMKTKDKNRIIEELKTGECGLAIGTHALIQEKIGFKNLGLAIVDEQHRFGVKQRATLKTHGNPHLLSLSATPIPRTLAMTIYGDQDISVIDELPKGRKPIITHIVPENKRSDAYKWLHEQVGIGHQIFIICPLIDESDVLEVKAVKKEFEYLSQDIFPDLKVGLLHGRLKQEEKDQIMNDFKNNKINILVSTSIIEVGIDIPNATIMIIEGSERFGLSQLHQFRGRVGRGDVQSYCLLFTNTSSPESLQRLNAMTRYRSGFDLAEIDLKLRGPGEIYGVRQSGIPDLKMASLTDYATIAKAREAAQKLIDKDPSLTEYPALKEKLIERKSHFCQVL